MPIFQYVAYTFQGKKQKGKIEALDQVQASQQLKEKGLQVVRLSPMQQSILFKEIEFLTPKVKSEEIVVFCRQFATLIKAGIPVADSIQILAQQCENKLLKKTLELVHQEIRSGTPLYHAFQEYSKVFPPIFVNMVRAGEASGNLDEVLEHLAVFFEKEHLTREKIKSAMTYPVTVSILAVIVTFFLLWKVVPQFVNTFANMGIELPLLTRIVIAISNGVVHYWYLVLSLPILMYFLFRLWVRTPKRRYTMDYLKLRIPIFGKLTQKAAMARFCRTFGSLFAATVPILQILDIVSHVVNNAVISKTIEESKENLRKGQPLANPYKSNWVFPPMVVHMIAVGEQSGSLDSVLNKVADFYEEDVGQMAERLKSILEPLMIIVVSVLVGIIVLAILLPTFSLYQNFR